MKFVVKSNFMFLFLLFQVLNNIMKKMLASNPYPKLEKLKKFKLVVLKSTDKSSAKVDDFLKRVAMMRMRLKRCEIQKTCANTKSFSI